MPYLDFLTLYILIFLNSLTMSAVWAGFAYIYRPHPAAQHWLAGTLLSLVGGIVLALQGNERAIAPAIVGNTIVIFGFAQFCVGLRRFHHRQGGQLLAVVFTLLAATAMLAMHDSDRGRAIVYASGQSIVVLACLLQLLRDRMPGIGTIIATIAFGTALLGQVLVIASNWMVLAEALDYAIYYSLASYALLCTVFSATIWNLGFALMSVDRLHGRLKTLSETDELTGLANRRAFRIRFNQLDRADANTFSLVLIDLNDFKPLNDKFGHLAGDEALKHFARLLRDSARPAGLAARLGGDEFALLLPDASLADAEALSEEIQRKLASSPLLLPKASITLSASIGAASASEQATSLFSLADRRLYQHKKTVKGRSNHALPQHLHLVAKG